MSGFRNIKNNTVRIIVLFPTDSYPTGLQLKPGKNKVPKDFLEEFESYEVESYEKKAKKNVKRYPGKEVLASLQKQVEIITGVNQRHVGPQIEMGEEWQPGEQEGVPLPMDIEFMGEKAAIALIQSVQDLPALKRWGTDSRPLVASAAKAKAAQVGG